MHAILTNLLAAIDDVNELEYLSLVVGDEEAINLNFKKLPSGFTHLTRMGFTKDEKLGLLQKFDFSGNILVYCVRFGFPELKCIVNRAESIRRRKMSTNIIRSRVAYEVVYDIKRLYADFVISNHFNMDEIEFEVDNIQILQYIQDGGLQHHSPDKTHKIADCIVHANGHEWRFNNDVKELGNTFKQEFHARVLKSLTRGKK